MCSMNGLAFDGRSDLLDSYRLCSGAHDCSFGIRLTPLCRSYAALRDMGKLVITV